MGVVFRGRDAPSQRDVALKLLPEHFANDAERLPRFEREAPATRLALNVTTMATVASGTVAGIIVGTPGFTELNPRNTSGVSPRAAFGERRIERDLTTRLRAEHVLTWLKRHTPAILQQPADQCGIDCDAG